MALSFAEDAKDAPSQTDVKILGVPRARARKRERERKREIVEGKDRKREGRGVARRLLPRLFRKFRIERFFKSRRTELLRCFCSSRLHSARGGGGYFIVLAFIPLARPPARSRESAGVPSGYKRIVRTNARRTSEH